MPLTRGGAFRLQRSQVTAWVHVSFPTRDGKSVAGNLVCLAAGIFPTQGAFVYVQDPKSGEVISVNDTGICRQMLRCRYAPAFIVPAIGVQNAISTGSTTKLVDVLKPIVTPAHRQNCPEFSAARANQSILTGMIKGKVEYHRVGLPTGTQMSLHQIVRSAPSRRGTLRRPET